MKSDHYLSYAQDELTRSAKDLCNDVYVMFLWVF